MWEGQPHPPAAAAAPVKGRTTYNDVRAGEKKTHDAFTEEASQLGTAKHVISRRNIFSKLPSGMQLFTLRQDL